MKYTKASFHESTYGDHIQLPKNPPLSLHAGDTIEVSGTEYNDGEYEVMYVQGRKIVVDPDAGLVGEVAKGVTITNRK